MEAPFGAQRIVKAEIVRVIRNFDGSYEEAGRLRDNRQRRHIADPGPWPGEFVPDAHRKEPRKGTGWLGDEPEDSGQVRLRRLPLFALGVIVGRCIIQEGEIGNEDGYRYWAQKRAMAVIQVAVQTDGRARIVNALREDLVGVPA